MPAVEPSMRPTGVEPPIIIKTKGTALGIKHDLVLSVGKDLPRSAFTQSRWELPETVEAVLPKPHDSMERENPHNFQAESEELEVLTDFENDEELELVELEAFKSVVTDIYYELRTHPLAFQRAYADDCIRGGLPRSPFFQRDDPIPFQRANFEAEIPKFQDIRKDPISFQRAYFLAGMPKEPPKVKKHQMDQKVIGKARGMIGL